MSETVLRDYLKNIEASYKAGIATEHTYRPALQKLLESLISGITALNEPKRVKCGAPDYDIVGEFKNERDSERKFIESQARKSNSPTISLCGAA